MKCYSESVLEEATGNWSDMCKIGEGGFGAVYRAWLSWDNSVVAVKQLGGQAGDPTAQK